MDTPTATFIALLILVLVCALGWSAPRWWVARRRRRLQQVAFPAVWRKILRRRVPMLRRLPADLQLQLKKHMQVFIAEKAFLGCAGLQITEEMRVVIAAQACLLLLNRPQGYYRKLRQILVYPGAFAVQRASTDGNGVQQEQRHALAGESWSQGQVILSWQDSLEGAATPDDGRNVVIHEFAHQLDQEKGTANGAPARSRRADPKRWSQVFHAAYAKLRRQAHVGEPGLLNHYGAQDPAEFFAVVSEVFFEQATELAEYDPALYRELCGYYRVDPANW
ncbi:zinc-dependent peptidase [Rhodoferax sp.]|uniref:M90 family metallopeptidase n=1 Tax=Rhodoferax sp. TaxID=50421 RepID=UPI00374D0A4C